MRQPFLDDRKLFFNGITGYEKNKEACMQGGIQMAKGKWLKTGAAAVMSITVLAGCGGSEDEPQMKQENDIPGQEQNDSDDDDEDSEEENEDED